MLLYQVAGFIDALVSEKLTKSALKSLLQEKLKAGAHPFFVEQVLRYVAQYDLPQSANLRTAAEDMVKQAQHRKGKVIPAGGTNVRNPLNRVYELGEKQGEDTPLLKGEGILQGVLVESFSNFVHEVRNHMDIGGGRMSGTMKGWFGMISLLCKHPQATVCLLDNALHLSYGLLERFDDVGSKPEQFLSAVQSEFFKSRIAAQGLSKTTLDLLDIWTEKSAYRFFGLLVELLRAAQDEQTDSAPATTVLRSLLNSGGGRSAKAKEVFCYPLRLNGKSHVTAEDMLTVMRFTFYMVDELRAELPAVSTVHAIAKWLKITTPANREDLICYLAFASKGALGIDPRCEFLLEELLGHEAWKALCELADPKHWGESRQIGPGFKMHAKLDSTIPEYTVYVEKLRAIQFENHNTRLAELVDQQVHDSGHTPQEARDACDRVVNLLAGDTIFTSTHLRLEWMRVKRLADEFLGAHIPRIDVAIHPKFGESGTACKFRIFFTEHPNDQISGLMDPEGKIELNNIAVLTPFGRNGIRAAVLESLGAILIPRYLERIPSPLRRGCGGNFTGEVWAARPTIHTLGQVTEEQEPQGPSFGNRINPVIALLVFEWLTGGAADCPFRLYRKVKERVEEAQTDDTYYIGWDSAKQQLLMERVTLSQVYLRTVRAHTKPVGVKVDKNGKVVVQQVSDRAKRNYRRFLSDTGRQLDMSPVRKTYELPGGVRIVLTLERTFNQGTFNTLDEVWAMIPNLTLKANAQHSFKF